MAMVPNRKKSFSEILIVSEARNKHQGTRAPNDRLQVKGARIKAEKEEIRKIG